MMRRALAVIAACFLVSTAFSQTITTGTITTTTYCAGASITVPFTVSGTFNPGNVYTAELSDISGNFVGAQIGTLTSSASGNLSITGTIPAITAEGSGVFKVRVKGSNPSSALLVQSPSSLTVHALGINAPTVSSTSICQGTNVTVSFTLFNGCAFPAGNTFTAELSDGFGSFASPQAVGSITSVGGGSTYNITATIPATTSGGNGYRIRVKSSLPGSGIASAANSGGNITVNAIGLNSPTVPLTTYCAGATFSITNVFSTTCNFLSGNQFQAQLSDASGSFASPTNISALITATTAANISVTIPTSTPAGSGYRIRVVSTNPVRTGIASTSDIQINQFGINAPTIATTTFCQGAAVTVPVSIQNGCNFPNTPSSNTFTAQLSDASGSFAAAQNIGFTTNANGGVNIAATIPVSTPAGTGYRIRIVSLNPNGSPVTSPDNGTNLTVTASSGTPTVFGTTAWNAYIYSGTNSTITNNIYLGTYTENNLSFASTSRWAAADGPGTANNATGNAYTGCAAPATNYSISFKRTNFTCGYYQIDFPSHDDDLRLFVNGTLVFSHIGCCDAHTNAWSGFLNASSQVEVQLINNGGPGNVSININAGTNPLTVSPATTICSTSSATLSVTSPLALTYAWTPTTGLTPSTGAGATVTAAPSSSTTYTVTGTDATTNCTVSKTVAVTVVSGTTVPTLTVTNSTPTICTGITATTLTVSGANTYTWSPATGLSSTTGSTVIADPPSNQTYTVTGTTGCQSASQNVSVVVQSIPPSPAATTFGNNEWNVYAYNDMTFSSYYGYYTQTALSFNTATRWATGAGPSAANSTGGAAYNGCNVSTTNNSISFKRTNFTCGYYQMNINYQDDRLTMFVDGVQVFQNNAFTSTAQNNVWSGFLTSTSQVELRLINTGGTGRLDITFGIVSGPQVLGPSVVICPDTDTPMTSSATAYPSATYQWSISPTDPTITFTDPNAANTTLNTTATTPSNTYTVTNTITDVGGTGCTATRTITVTVAATPSTAVTPTTTTLLCPTATATLTATGANTYTWSPTTGLTIPPGPGNVVTAQPTATTTYTVTGNNGCTTSTAQVTVTVNNLPDPITTFPSGVWNVYGFNSQTIGTNYQGYYTDNGTGTPPYSFNTGTRWSQTSAPSTASNLNGSPWNGCPMPNTNYSLSAKRQGFLCGTYTIDIPAHDDAVTVFVNGVQVAQHASCCDSHTAIWTGVLTTTSTVEIQLVQGTGNAYLAATFNRTAPTASSTIWVGTVDTDWFTTSNWCVTAPTSSILVSIPAGAPNMPVINASGAAAFSVTIAPAVAATSVSSAVPAGSLSMGAFNLDIANGWTNNGIFNAGTGSVSFIGSSPGATISGSTTFNDIIINRNNGVTISGGTQQVNGTMNLTNGIVTQNGTLKFNAGSSVINASNTSHVVGTVTKTGNTSFTFPVGRGGLYRPIGISAPSVATDTYTANYFNTSALGTYSNTSRSITFDHVSNAEYWMFNRTVGTSPVNVTLSWNTNSGGVFDPASLRVGGWNGSLWADLGNASTTGNATAGTLTASVASSSSGPYTLASTTFFNALPVQLSNMQCGINDFGNPEINWTTEVEANSDYFEVERSNDGHDFIVAGRIASKGDSRDIQRYSFEDLHAPPGKMYYRLKQVDRNGHGTYYEVCSMEVEATGLSVAPNPTTGKAIIKLYGRLNELIVVNSVGQKVNVDFVVKDSIVELDLSSLAPGVYLVRISTVDKSGILKLVKS